jgi:hypothetical protein
VKDARSQNSSSLHSANKHGETHQKFRIVPVPEWVTNTAKAMKKKPLINTYR